jgi:hypothetical protein
VYRSWTILLYSYRGSTVLLYSYRGSTILLYSYKSPQACWPPALHRGV